MTLNEIIGSCESVAVQFPGAVSFAEYKFTLEYADSTRSNREGRTAIYGMYVCREKWLQK